MTVTITYDEGVGKVLAGPVKTGGYRIALIAKDGKIHHFVNGADRQECIQGLRAWGFEVQEDN